MALVSTKRHFFLYIRYSLLVQLAIGMQYLLADFEAAESGNHDFFSDFGDEVIQ